MTNGMVFDGTQDLHNGEFPSVPAIYFIISENKVQYIGSTANLKQRLMVCHHKQNAFSTLNNAKVSWLNCDLDKIDDTERHFIAKINPPLNAVIGIGAGAGNTNAKRKDGKTRVFLNVRVERDTLKALKELSKIEKCTVTTLVNRILEKELSI